MFTQRNILFALSALLIVVGGYTTLKPQSVQPEQTEQTEELSEYEQNKAIALASLEPDGEAAEMLANLEPAAGEEASADMDADPTLPEEKKAHILAHHKSGTGVACKSEFPATWNDDKIIETVKALAANDNVDWKQEDNGYFVGEQDVDGLKVRAVVNREDNTIVTGYPISVERNPCPTREPANDNEKPAE